MLPDGTIPASLTGLLAVFCFFLLRPVGCQYRARGVDLLFYSASDCVGGTLPLVCVIFGDTVWSVLVYEASGRVVRWRWWYQCSWRLMHLLGSREPQAWVGDRPCGLSSGGTRGGRRVGGVSWRDGDCPGLTCGSEASVRLALSAVIVATWIAWQVCGMRRGSGG
jgi:hypothetical protein